MLTGTTFNPNGQYSPEVFNQFDVLRLPIWADHVEFVKALQCEPLIVIDSTTFNSYSIEDLLAAYPFVKFWQIGNEPDHVSPSSWTLSQADYSDLIDVCKSVLASKVLIGAGLVSGDSEWLKGVPSAKFLDAIAVHPYGQKPDSWTEEWGFGYASDLINTYKQYDKPIWVTEFGWDSDNQQERAGYHAEMLRSLAKVGVAVALQFAFTDDVPGFGLIGTETSYALQTLRDTLH